MKKIVRMSIAAAMMMGVGSVSAQAEGIDLVDNVKVNGQIRARFENVDMDGKQDANAFTNRLRIGASADLLGLDWLSGYVEMTDVRNINDNYNSTDNGKTTHAVVADPEQTRLTQSYLDLKYGATKLRVGRQEINLDNQRFIGSVGWRQMFQTMDAYTITNNSIENLNVFASYITQRNTVKAGAAENVDTRDLLVNVSYKVMPELKVTAYSYMLGSEHDTYGLSLTGNVAVADGVKINYRAEYATQDDSSIDDSGMDEAKADADYYNLALGLNMSGILVGAGYESLSGSNGTDGDTAFKTPYSTLHAHNGWADMFLGNGGSPLGGLEDVSAYVGYKAKGFGLAKVIYHDFQSEEGSTDYGTEIDAIYKNKVPGVNGLSAMLKFADFDSDNVAYADTTKIWVMVDYKFSSK